MRYFKTLCASLVIISGTVSVVLWRALSDEKDVSSALRARLTDSERVADPVSITAVPSAKSLALVDGTSRSLADAGAVVVVHDSVGPRGPAMREPSDLLRDAEYRKARIAQVRATVEQSYPGLMEELGLSKDEANRIFDLLAENQVDQLASSIKVGDDGKVDRLQMQEAARNMDQLRAKLQAEITAQFGAARYSSFQAYQAQRPARLQASQFGRTLQSSGIPLSGTQLRSLTEVAIAEQIRQRDEMRTMAREPRPEGLGVRQIEEASFERQKNNNNRLLEAASSYLSPRQIEVLRADMEQRLTLSRVASRRQRDTDVPSPAN